MHLGFSICSKNEVDRLFGDCEPRGVGANEDLGQKGEIVVLVGEIVNGARRVDAVPRGLVFREADRIGEPSIRLGASK